MSLNKRDLNIEKREFDEQLARTQYEAEKAIFELFKMNFDKEEFLNNIFCFPDWPKTIEDCQNYHFHMMFRYEQQKILNQPEFKFANMSIYGFLEDLYHKEHSEIKKRKYIEKNIDDKKEQEKMDLILKEFDEFK